ncbi:DUF6671 family protein [Micromonospora endolithica]|uniref:DUF6671 family protein n=1 Tax=Micromonospora endolithica TaxID=230091 RepID=UPI0011AC64F6|nr:DUF6671 family protein [Micromonospora endolithica]TWJ25153.1 hypothetical protein JD76_05316 [Micromonospora endolithica]
MVVPLLHDVPASLATLHGKQWPLRPLFARWLGLRLRVAAIDTDSFGTFTGEVPRSGSARETVIRKARAGMAASGCRVGLASEGSFGPYPGTPWLAADVEYVAFVDDRLGLTVVESVLSAETNHGHVVTDGRDLGSLLAFLRRCGFPSHAVTVQPATGGGRPVKGVHRLGELISTVRDAARLSADGRVRVSADLRAHVNPSRMRVIAAAGRRLAERLATPCPACAMPGFGRVETVMGLPCEACWCPTDQVATVVRCCVSCPYTARTERTGGADPSVCERCNP